MIALYCGGGGTIVFRHELIWLIPRKPTQTVEFWRNGGRAPFHLLLAVAFSKIWKHVKNIMGFKGLSSLTGFGAEPQNIARRIGNANRRAGVAA